MGALAEEDKAEPRNEKEIYKDDDNTDVLKQQLFDSRNVLGRVLIATLFIMGN